MLYTGCAGSIALSGSVKILNGREVDATSSFTSVTRYNWAPLPPKVWGTSSSPSQVKYILACSTVGAPFAGAFLDAQTAGSRAPNWAPGCGCAQREVPPKSIKKAEKVRVFISSPDFAAR